MNTNYLDHFIDDVHKAHVRAIELRDYHDHSLIEKSDLLTKTLDQLFDNIEELQVADAELRAQQEELVERQTDIAQQRQYYMELFDFAPDAYIVTDSLGTIMEANQAAAVLLNRRRDMLTGKPLSVFIDTNRRAEFRDKLGELRVNRQQLYWETDVLPTRSGTIKASVSAKPLTSGYGMGQRFAWLIRKADDERSQRLLQEKQEEARRVQWMGTISHELRTPLSSIKGFVSSLLAKDVEFDANTRREFLEIVEAETDKVTELVSQLLEFSRVQSGTLRITPHAQSLADVVSVARAGLKGLTESHQLQIDLPDDLPFVSVDSQRISQVLLNLVDNAAKYSPEQSTIIICAHRDGAMVQVEVADVGEGIPPGDRPHIFEAYHQTTRPSQKKGTGLGLAICKGIIEAHGGTIWIQDRPAPGTTVCFTVPAADEHEG